MTAYNFMLAIVENDLATIQETVDPDFQQEAMESILAQVGLQALLNALVGAGWGADYTELRVQTISNDDHRAVVRMRAKMRLTALGSQMVIPVNADLPLMHIPTDRDHLYRLMANTISRHLVHRSDGCRTRFRQSANTIPTPLVHRYGRATA